MKFRLILLLVILMTGFLLQPDHVNPVLSQYNINDLSDWTEHKAKLRFEVQDKVYGFIPSQLNPAFEVVKNSSLPSVDAKYKEIKISFEGLQKNILLSLFLPKNNKPSGVFLVLNRCGAHTILSDDIISIRPHAEHHKQCLNLQNRGSDKKHYAVSEILDSGYAFATIDGADLAADGYKHKGIKKSNKTSDLRSLVQTHKTKEKSWGAIAAWAYGYQLGARYLKLDRGIKPDQIIASGHSRRGKAALLAAALDESISMVVAHQSGTGGTASFRKSIFKESPKTMVSKSWIYSAIGDPGTLAHFFSKYFKQKVNKDGLSSLDLDASHLMAMVAPRPLLDTQGVKDFWAGGKSAWRMMKEANSVYGLYGIQGLKKSKWLSLRHAQLNSNNTGRLHQHYLNTGHRINKNYWQLSVEFANLHFLKN